MITVDKYCIAKIFEKWFSKSILETNISNFSDHEIYEKALSIFKFDYERYYPNDSEIYLEKIVLKAELQGILLYRVAHQYFIINNELCDLYSLLGRYLSGFEIYYSADIGKGLKINHGLGTVVGARVKLGENCLLHQNVTFGDKDNGRPILGNNVIVYAGAKILGDILIENNVVIGANTVCFINVPENSTVIGIPARIIRKK